MDNCVKAKAVWEGWTIQGRANQFPRKADMTVGTVSPHRTVCPDTWVLFCYASSLVTFGLCAAPLTLWEDWCHQRIKQESVSINNTSQVSQAVCLGLR